MKTTPHQPLKTVLAAGLLAGALVATCSADIIYQDTFARASAGPLSGTPPTVDNTGANATWTADAAYTSDGTNGIVSNSYYGGASLPLDWATYPDPRAQVDVKLGDSGSWFQLVLGSCSYWGTPGETAVLQINGNGDVAAYTGPGYAFTTLTNMSGAGVALGWNRLRIEYSNTVGTATFYLNGNVIVQDVPLTSQSTGVGFDFFGGPNTYFTNLLVTFGNEATFPPSINTQPKGQTAFVGDPVALDVDVSGTLPLQYIWCKDGVPIPGPNANTYGFTSTSTSDSGNYSVIITNAYGAKTTDVARVDVHLEQQSPLAQVNFDDQTNNLYEFGFTYSGPAPGANLPVTWTNAPGDGVGGTTGLAINADGSDFNNVSVSYAGLGGGVGLTLPKLATYNLDCYEAYCSAKVENLKDGTTNTPGRIALRFYIPDPTNATATIDILDVTRSVTYTSNYQAFAFVLNTADYGGADGLTNFVQNYTNVTRVQFEFTCDSLYSDFVNGPGDAIVLDDVKLAYRHSPPISAARNGNQTVLQWADPNLSLQGAASVAGPYVVIPGATSPYPVPGNSPYNFFRTSFAPVP